jgi:hypothetical protein
LTATFVDLNNMSEDFHVHGAHDHAVEHHAQGGDNLATYVAMFTAILASIGAIVSYQGGDTQNQAMLLKNEAVLKKAEASDQWNFYEAQSNKVHLMELAAEIAPAKKQGYYKSQIEKHRQEQAETRTKAEALDAESAQAEKRSEQEIHPHHQLALAMTFIQIAISLASITVLTRKKWLLLVAAISAAGGLAMWGAALLA